MKVILKGITPYNYEIHGDIDDDLIYWISLLKQVPYPLEIFAQDKFPHTVDLSQYITDTKYPEDSQDWGLTWFDYEEVKD